jgi:hypothetical protein
VLPTQAEATEKTKELNPNVAPLVERVRHTSLVDPISGTNRNQLGGTAMSAS